jgi:hypothetical protein
VNDRVGARHLTGIDTSSHNVEVEARSQMIVELTDASVLEIFWRTHVNRPYPLHAVMDFFSSFTHQPDMLKLRHWLARQRSWEPVRNTGDRAIVKLVAAAVTTGELVVVDHNMGQRWPGTGTLMRLRSGSVVLIPRRALRPARDLGRALEWLYGAPTPVELQRLRELLWSYKQGTSPLEVGGDFPTIVEKLLRSGQLVPVFHPFPRLAAGSTGDLPPVAPLPVARGLAGGEQLPESATFGPDHATAAQIAAMMAAAEAGIPFCEECSKEQSSRSAS